MNAEELQRLVERARVEETVATRPPVDLLTRARTLRRRRRRGIGAALVTGGLVVATISGVALFHGDSGADKAVTTHRPVPPQGDIAVWTVEDPLQISDTSTYFTALVSRLECSGGRNGPVNEPQIEYHEAQIVVTFTVEPLRPGVAYDCLGTAGDPFTVHLAEPVDGRALVDGACRAEGPIASSSACTFNDPVRWSAEIAANADHCHDTYATLTQGIQRLGVFPIKGSATFSAGRPVVWSKYGSCALDLRFTVDHAVGTDAADHESLTLAPGRHRVDVFIPTCSQHPSPDCRGGLVTVTSHITVR